MKKLWMVLIGFLMTIGMAFAAVNINSADEKSLDAIKGIGAVKAKAIVDERTKNGPFKSLDDVEKRVKGIGPATIAQWQKDGSVRVGGGTPAKADAKKEEKKDAAKAAAPAPAAAPAKADAKAKKDAVDKKAKDDAKKAKDAPKADAKKDAKDDKKDSKDAPKADAKK